MRKIFRLHQFWQERSVRELRDLVRQLRSRAIFHRKVHQYNTRITKQQLISMLDLKFYVRVHPDYPGVVIRSRYVDFEFYFFQNQFYLDRELTTLF